LIGDSAFELHIYLSFGKFKVDREMNLSKKYIKGITLLTIKGQKMKLNDKKFFKYVKNTKDDFAYMGKLEVVNKLNYLLRTKEITLVSILDVAMIIQLRIDNLEYIKSVEDEKTFNLINKEHKYMKAVLERYFIFDNNDETGLLVITIKDKK